MGWRDEYVIHPACDALPMLSDEEIDALAKDIKANGIRSEIGLLNTGKPDEKEVLLDGRNRLEAMERAGIELLPWQKRYVALKSDKQIWAYVLSQNLHRRHLTKQQRADAIAAAAKAAEGRKKKHGQVGQVSKGGRGKANPVKAKALEINRSLPKEEQVSERTLRRAVAKAEGRDPKPKPKPKLPKRKSRSAATRW